MTSQAKEINVVVTDPITKGSLVLVRREQIEEADLAFVMNELRRAAGHDRFMLLALVEGASVDVHGPEDLVDALNEVARRAVDEALNKVLKEIARDGN